MTISRLTSTIRDPTSAQRPAAMLAAPEAAEVGPEAVAGTRAALRAAALVGLARRATSATLNSASRQRAGGQRRTTASRQTCLEEAEGVEVELGEDAGEAEAACGAGEEAEEAEERRSRVWARAEGASAPARSVCISECHRFLVVCSVSKLLYTFLLYTAFRVVFSLPALPATLRPSPALGLGGLGLIDLNLRLTLSWLAF